MKSQPARREASWTAVASRTRHRFRTHGKLPDGVAFLCARKRRRRCALPAHSKIPTAAGLVCFFRDTVNDETVPDGIPPAVPWEELEKKMKVPKQAKNVRGKLNVPRERFRLRESGYAWAGVCK